MKVGVGEGEKSSIFIEFFNFLTKPKIAYGHMTHNLIGNFVLIILSYKLLILDPPPQSNSEKRDFTYFSYRERVKNVFLKQKTTNMPQDRHKKWVFRSPRVSCNGKKR